MRYMKKKFIGIITFSCLLYSLGAATITYHYDKQYRLTQVKYSESEVASYSYDAADNLTLYVAVTDSSYLKSFLFFLSRYPLEEPRPLCWRDDYHPADKDTYFG
ncbi:MAG: hypothetical protein EOM12_15530 [Verrucomicrobiae bacterium]|nr:hypothetical protein [Verrucomicrobiae bacterium]